MSPDSRDAVQAVLHDSYLVESILTRCDVDLTPGDMEDTAAVDHHGMFHWDPKKHLRRAALVNRVFHGVATRLLFAEMSFDIFSRLHPDMAPTESMGKAFAGYLKHVKTLIFTSTASLTQQLPYLANSEYKDSLRHLVAHSFGMHAEEEPEIIVDMRGRTVHLDAMGTLDERDHVHVRAMSQQMFGESKAERWPRSFKVIRAVNLSLQDDLPGAYQGSYQEFYTPHAPMTRDVKVKPLKDLLDYERGSKKRGTGQQDEEWIISAKTVDTKNMTVIEALVSHPRFQGLVIEQNDVPLEDIITILQKGSFKTLDIGNMGVGTEDSRWSATKLHAVLDGIAASAIEYVALNICMSEEALNELRQMAAGDQRESEGGHPKYQACVEFILYSAEPQLYQGVELWQRLFPQWSWCRPAELTPHLVKSQLHLQITCTTMDFEENTRILMGDMEMTGSMGMFMDV